MISSTALSTFGVVDDRAKRKPRPDQTNREEREKKKRAGTERREPARLKKLCACLFFEGFRHTCRTSCRSRGEKT